MTSEITSRPLSVPRVYAALEDPSCGGVVIFVGRVRPDRSLRGRVSALDYEADRALALRQLETLEREAGWRFGAGKIRIEHRIGRLPVGTPSVIVGVAAPHRSAAFQAARFLIERLKTGVPIWKTDRWGRVARNGQRPRAQRTRPSR